MPVSFYDPLVTAESFWQLPPRANPNVQKKTVKEDVNSEGKGVRTAASKVEEKNTAAASATASATKEGVEETQEDSLMKVTEPPETSGAIAETSAYNTHIRHAACVESFTAGFWL